jgi:Ca-activated chloride channel family protein
MTGYPIDLSKQLMTKLLKENVRSGDSLNILLFAGGSQVLSADGNVEATPNNIDNALSWLDQNMHAGGGTQLLPALRTAFDLPGFTANVAKTIIIMTDGYVTVEKEAFDLVRNNLGVGNVFVFGVGSSVNRYLIEGLARVGYGEPFVVMNEAEGSAAVEQLQRYIDTPVLTQLKLAFTGSFIAKDQEPPHLPDLFASRPIQVVGKWEGQLSGNFTVQGRLPDGSLWEYYGSLASMQVVDLPSVPLLWARSRIAVLGDYGTVGVQAENEITALGLNYSLMTQYTSFVSVDSNPEVPGMCGVTASYNTTTTNRAGGMMQTDELSGSRAFSAGMGYDSGGCFRAAHLAILIMSFIAVV